MDELVRTLNDLEVELVVMNIDGLRCHEAWDAVLSAEWQLGKREHGSLRTKTKESVSNSKLCEGSDPPF
jgi:hypothetical protein